jgi:hypothetical protein
MVVQAHALVNPSKGPARELCGSKKHADRSVLHGAHLCSADEVEHGQYVLTQPDILSV